ncbi:MAG: metallophosphoesterase family protein [bacterium]
MARLAVISDIHGNRLALEEVLRDLDRRNVDAVLCLGDIVGYGPEPSECVRMVRRTCRVAIRGNHEDGVLARESARGWNPVAQAGLAYARRVLSASDLAFLAELPASFAVGRTLLAVHDSPVPSDHGMNYLRNARDAADAFFWLRDRICLIGHTHVAACFTTTTAVGTRPHPEDLHAIASLVANGESAVEDWSASALVETVELPAEGRAIVNPGSVGQPRDRDPRASYAIIDLERSVAEFHRVAYDIEEAARRTIAAGLPSVLGERLAIGA